MKTYWLSCYAMTVTVVVDEKHTIIAASPIVKRFVGQPLGNLGRWMANKGGFQAKEL